MNATDKNPEQEIKAPVSVRQPDRRDQSKIETHPLKAWLDYYGIRTEDLARATKRVAPPGLHNSFIRHIYKDGGVASKKSILKLSKATGIPAAMLMFPEDFPDFNPEEYKPKDEIGQASCLTIQTQ